MAQTITRFLQHMHEHALDEKTRSFQETITTLQERHDEEIKALQARASAQKDRHEEETTALHEAIVNLQNRHNDYDGEISSLKEAVTALRTFPKEQDRSLGQSYPRGVKRARADDEAPRCEGKSQSRVEDRGERKIQSCVEVRGEGKSQSREDRAAARQEDFVDYFKSMRDEFMTGNYEKYQRAFICRFIDGIQDPVLSRWFQESLKERFPDMVHDEKRSARKGGGRLVRPTRDLTWEDIEIALKHSEWPFMHD